MPTTTSDFDSATWKAQRDAPAQENKRGTMVTALEQAVHAGMPRAEVITLLGEPDSRDADIDTYELGVSPLGVDEEVYEITYRDGVVASLGWKRR
ncbi:hypothetical protein [Xanthomonas sp. XNM01]|uniref:hypothetical protein n=1 Tax=Xanthomonas sp. XNM01 TaxID=2769289 RepID=UPI00177EB04D|nr:hypothetical protein [Xanthomonas sp. XNM01]MBD9369246.1 hypothetical protein [Xanthomonas sp. XNM01]